MSNLQIIRPRQLCSLLDIHLSTLYRWHEEGNIPIEKVKFGPRAVGYRKSDVDAWLNGEFESESKTEVQ